MKYSVSFLLFLATAAPSFAQDRIDAASYATPPKNEF